MTDLAYCHDDVTTQAEGRDMRRLAENPPLSDPLPLQPKRAASFAVARHRLDIPLANGGLDPHAESKARYKKSAFVETKKSRYNKHTPSSRPADTQHEGMKDDFDIAVKKAKTENLARRNSRSATLQLATYRALIQTVDLLNPKLSEEERLRRARRLVQAYARVRERRPKFHDDAPELRLARSLINRFQYQQRLKRQAAPNLAAG